MLWAAVSGVLFVWLLWFVFVDVPVLEVSRNARLEVVSAAHPVSTPVNGQVVRSDIVLGNKVQAGEVLIELDSRAQRLLLAEEQARIESIPLEREIVLAQTESYEQAIRFAGQTADEALNGAKRLHEELKIVAQFEKENARRMKVLQSSGQLPELELLRFRLNSDRSQSAVIAQALEIEKLVSGSSSELHKDEVDLLALKRDIAVLDRQLELSKASVARLREEIDKRVIRAPVSGEIGAMAPIEIGSVVNTGSVIAQIIPSGALKIVADYAPERVLGRIRKGQSALMRLDAFPWAQYGVVEARVDRVASEINNGAVRVEFALNNELENAQYLRHGLTGSVEINIETITPAVLVLRSTGQMIVKPVDQALGVETAMR